MLQLLKELKKLARVNKSECVKARAGEREQACEPVCVPPGAHTGRSFLRSSNKRRPGVQHGAPADLALVLAERVLECRREK